MILNIDIECADKLHSDMFYMSKFIKDTLISTDWKRKNLTECAKIKRNEKINEELKFIGSAKQQKC
jgi:hypothetical protein